jgi:ubiquinol-cytochrome c reductase cytochrome b subunit
LIGIQVVTGLLLVLRYTDREEAFDSVQYLILETTYGYFIRILHFNGAAFIFIVLYLHLFKGLFYGSYRLSKVWGVGILLLVLIIATAFTGYVLLYSQISYWAAMVIINFFRTIPIVGNNLVLLIFGRFIVRRRTLKLFFAVHFLIPFLILLIIVVHLYFLHEHGRSSSLSLVNDDSKIYFYPRYAMKDSINLVVILIG